VRRLRDLAIFELGAMAGMVATAMFVKRAVSSRGGEDSDEVALVAIFDGVDLKSRAKAFTGDSMLSWFGGIAVDLRDAELAAGAQLSLYTLFGGIAIKTPPDWQLDSDMKALAGGVDARTRAQIGSDAPVLKLHGLALFGGIAVGPGAERDPQ
jgi:hypothetical protein